MNKLLEVYSKGLFNTLTDDQVDGVVDLFQNITLSDPKKELGEMFKNRTIKKDDKIKKVVMCSGKNYYDLVQAREKFKKSKIKNLGRMKIFKNDVLVLELDNYGTVSYTHLTLPTKA